MKQPTALARTTLVSLLCAVMLGCQRNATAESEIKALQFIKCAARRADSLPQPKWSLRDLQALEATDRNLIAASDLARAAERVSVSHRRFVECLQRYRPPPRRD